jgi:hypothetical protein
VRRALAAAFLVATSLTATAPARATGFTDIGEDIVPRTDVGFRVDGYLRARAEDLYNLDLDRGLTPSGQPLFPVPLGNPNAQAITYADMRLRTDFAAYAPGGTVAVKARVDVLDNIPLGGNAQGIPAQSTTQISPSEAFRVKRAYGEALTPIGLLAVGRMGSHWGLGMLTHGGDCADCNYGDAADRIALITPIAGHIWALSYDIDQIGPFVPTPAGGTLLNLSPSADVHTVTFAMLRYKDDAARRRRRAAGKTTSSTGRTSPSAGRTTTCRGPTCPRRSRSRSTTRRSWRAATRPSPWMRGPASRTRCSGSRPSGRSSSARSSRPRSSPACSITSL